MTLQTFESELRGKHIKIFCDNTTAVSYVNEMEGTKSLACNKIAVVIRDWCIVKNAWVTCSHIPGNRNIKADLASHKINDRLEWKLNSDVFLSLCSVFGTPSIDLFASRINTQLKTFCSWKPDPLATYIDVFSLHWAQFDLPYLFPPFSLIARCLQKVREEGASVWMVVPFWMLQPWMEMLLSMLTDHPQLIMRKKGVLTHPASGEEHPVMSHTKLMACRLSGILYDNRVFMQRLQTLSLLPGSQAQESSITHTLDGGPSFVLEGISVPLLPLWPTL